MRRIITDTRPVLQTDRQQFFLMHRNKHREVSKMRKQKYVLNERIKQNLKGP